MDGIHRPRGRAAALAAALLATTLAFGQPAAAAVVDDGPYDRLLQAYVKDGAVDYAGLKGEEAALDAWLAALARADLSGASRAERLAFWINAYNAATLKLILRHHGAIRSIRDIADPWKRPDWRIAGETLSLDQMEHEKLRRDIGEPRVHFALVCAARGCPDLRSRAYTAAGVDAELDEAARRFVRSAKGARLAERDGKPVLLLSKLFEWYGADFAAEGRTVPQALARWADAAVAQAVAEHGPALAVDWIEYDWRLNGR